MLPVSRFNRMTSRRKLNSASAAFCFKAAVIFINLGWIAGRKEVWNRSAAGSAAGLMSSSSSPKRLPALELVHDERSPLLETLIRRVSQNDREETTGSEYEQLYLD